MVSAISTLATWLHAAQENKTKNRKIIRFPACSFGFEEQKNFEHTNDCHPWTWSIIIHLLFQRRDCGKREYLEWNGIFYFILCHSIRKSFVSLVYLLCTSHAHCNSDIRWKERWIDLFWFNAWYIHLNAHRQHSGCGELKISDTITFQR